MILPLLATSNDRLTRQLEFVIEIDKLKSVFRHTLLMDASRRENDAEHAWHLAMLAVTLAEHANVREIDLLKVIKMVLIHDIVEIDCGDVLVYDTALREAQKAKEAVAAKRIFGMLPSPHGNEFETLWQEFEARETSEAKFAAALDRFQPILHNYITGGVSWQKEGVTAAQVLSVNKHIAEGSNQLWEEVQRMVADAVKRGILRDH